MTVLTIRQFLFLYPSQCFYNQKIIIKTNYRTSVLPRYQYNRQHLCTALKIFKSMPQMNQLLSRSMSFMGLHTASLHSYSSDDGRQYTQYRKENEKLYQQQKQLKNHNTIKDCVLQCLQNSSFCGTTQRVTPQSIVLQLKEIRQEMKETKQAMKELIYELMQ